jgi:hypothetical protein
MGAHVAAPTDTLEGVRRIDRWAHKYATELVDVSPKLAG